MITETIDITNKHERHQFTAYIGQAYSEMGLLGEYENAINIIIKDLKDTKTRIDTVSNPVLYMMRHSLELGYKSNLEYFEQYSNRKTTKKLFGCHDLQKLHSEFKTHFYLINATLNFDTDLVTEFNKYYAHTATLIRELGATESASFRYTKDIKGQRIFQPTETKDIGKIKELYDKAITMLVYTSSLISPYTDYKDLTTKVPTFQNGMGIVQMKFPLSQLDTFAEKLSKKHKKIDNLKWKDEAKRQILSVIIVNDNCYLTPVIQ